MTTPNQKQQQLPLTLLIGCRICIATYDLRTASYVTGPL